MKRAGKIAVVGGGVFGVTAALELRTRGFEVELLDPGPLPHPEASSTDLSKAVRMDYGRDTFYADFAASALERWRAWNRDGARPLFHEVGILMISESAMESGGFEADSFESMRGRGVPVERVDADTLGRRFPAWRDGPYVDGYFNPEAGWVESGEVMSRLIDAARANGVRVRESTRVSRLIETGARVEGVVLEPDGELRTDMVVVAGGAWTPALLPWLRPMMQAIGQPVVHFEPTDPEPFTGERYPVWCADIARTGWYGFPLSAAGTVKIGNHGPGRAIAPGEALEVREEERERAVAYARRTFPSLADARLHTERLCLYCDTWDGNFLIDHDPERSALLVATGGSGHAFKFAPVLGEIIADVLEGRDNPYAGRFAWREPGSSPGEQARSR